MVKQQVQTLESIRVPSSFYLLPSTFRLRSSDFRLRSFDFGLLTSVFYNIPQTPLRYAQGKLFKGGIADSLPSNF